MIRGFSKHETIRNCFRSVYVTYTYEEKKRFPSEDSNRTTLKLSHLELFTAVIRGKYVWEKKFHQTKPSSGVLALCLSQLINLHLEYPQCLEFMSKYLLGRNFMIRATQPKS